MQPTPQLSPKTETTIKPFKAIVNLTVTVEHDIDGVEETTAVLTTNPSARDWLKRKTETVFGAILDIVQHGFPPPMGIPDMNFPIGEPMDEQPAEPQPQPVPNDGEVSTDQP